MYNVYSYCGSHEPIHTVLVHCPLSSSPPTTTILLSATLTTAGPLLADGACPITSQL